MQSTIYPIGTKYKTMGKHPLECTVIDIWKTYNSQGELVKLRYVSTHPFCGQQVQEIDVNPVTIARGLIK